MSTVRHDELLATADRLLSASLRGSDGQWPRTCALLIRLALETTLDEYWARAEPSARDSSMRAQLLLHHHAYELAPTAAELRRWHANVTQLAGMLSGHY